MSYETIEIESEDADKVHVLIGTVDEIYSDDDVAWTADVDIDGYGLVTDVPAFYNCQDLGVAILMPFSKGDRVIIINSGNAISLSTENMKIIGFEDGLPMSCGIPAYLDGVIFRRVWNSTWTNVRDNSFGIATTTTSRLSIYAGYENPPAPLTYYYHIGRAFLNFDLSSLSRTVTGVTLRIYSNNSSDAIRMIVQKGTQGDSTLIDDDYSSFEEPIFSDLTINSEYKSKNDFIFNEAGISYINSVIGDKAKLCLREYAHDYLNIAPTDNPQAFGYSLFSVGGEAMVGQLILI